jgi:hypothetical protein
MKERKFVGKKVSVCSKSFEANNEVFLAYTLIKIDTSEIQTHFYGRRDIQHNDTQLNDAQYKGLISLFPTLSTMEQCIIDTNAGRQQS